MTGKRDEAYVDALLELAAEGTVPQGSKSRGEETGDDEEPFFDDRPDGDVDLDAIFKDAEVEETPAPRGDNDHLRRLDELFGSRGSVRDEFAAFVDRLGLRYFAPAELLVMGGSNQRGPCAGKNRIPPKTKWPNIVPTILALDDIRHDLGYAIRTTSVYRGPEYNECLRQHSSGVARYSQHRAFRAIDFQGVQGSPRDWGAAVKRLTDRTSRYGIWTRTYRTFVHIDSRYVGRGVGV